MTDQQRGGITPAPTVHPDEIRHWSDGPDTYVIVKAKDVQLGAQTYALTQPQAQQAKACHDSDCSVNNAPALPVGPCDCGFEAQQAAAVPPITEHGAGGQPT